jgi:hypothetical protein
MFTLKTISAFKSASFPDKDGSVGCQYCLCVTVLNFKASLSTHTSTSDMSITDRKLGAGFLLNQVVVM